MEKNASIYCIVWNLVAKFQIEIVNRSALYLTLQFTWLCILLRLPCMQLRPQSVELEYFFTHSGH